MNMDSDNQETLSEEKEPENVSECNKKINKYIKFPVLTIEKILRLVIVTGGTIFMIVSFFTGIGYSHHEIECINDIPQDDTERINNYFYENEGFALAVKFIISFIIDILIIYTLIVWSLFGTNIRLLTAGCSYMVINLLIRFLHIQKPRDKSAFLKSHIFSFFVNYQTTSYSFFPTTLGIILICAFEWKRNRAKHMFYIMFILMIIYGAILIAMRGNYWHEVFTSVLFGHYVFMMNEKVLAMIKGKEYLDNEININKEAILPKKIEEDGKNINEMKSNYNSDTSDEDK